MLCYVKSLQSCPALCDPIDGSPPGSNVPGILQARTLEGVAISFSNAWKWKMKVKSLSHVQLLVIPWTAAHQAPPSMGFSRQECWNGVSLPSPNQQLNASPKQALCIQNTITFGKMTFQNERPALNWDLKIFFPSNTTGKSSVLQSMGWQRVGYYWATEMNWTELRYPSLTI